MNGTMDARWCICYRHSLVDPFTRNRWGEVGASLFHKKVSWVSNFKIWRVMNSFYFCWFAFPFLTLLTPIVLPIFFWGPRVDSDLKKRADMKHIRRIGPTKSLLYFVRQRYMCMPIFHLHSSHLSKERMSRKKIKFVKLQEKCYPWFFG
jgi:hypothetical protein